MNKYQPSQMDLRNELPLVHQAIYSPVFHTKREANFTTQSAHIYVKKGKVFPYSLPSVGPGADPGVQAVSPQVT